MSRTKHQVPTVKAEWLLLDSVENAGLRKHLLGCVVPRETIYTPFDKYRPDFADDDLDTVMEDGKTKRKLLYNAMGKLWNPTKHFGADEPNASTKPGDGEAPVQLRDVFTGKYFAKSQSMQADITSLFNIFIRKSEMQQVSIHAGTIRRYKIDNADARLAKDLLHCPPWRAGLQELFDRTTDKEGGFFLVTGVGICEELTVSWQLQKDNDLKTSVKLDGNAILAAAGAPPNPELARYIDTKFDVAQAKIEGEQILATCKESVIFAVRYNYLNLEYEKLDKKESVLAKSLKMFTKSPRPGKIKDAKLGEVFLGKGINAFAGPSDTPLDEGVEDDIFYRRPARVASDPDPNTASEANGSATI